MATPFSIATVALDNGARIGISPLPGRGGQIDTDMIELLRWRPVAVVSMTEWAEIERVGATDLPSRLADARIIWRHLPIADYGGPQGDSADAWPALSAELHTILDKGGAVLTHCYGGHGRSGMVTLRLMVERGENAHRALERIRTARRGAVQAETQFHWGAAGAQHLWTKEKGPPQRPFE